MTDPQLGVSEEVVGIDVERVSSWLADHVDGLIPPFTFALVSGGRSNLTFEVTDGAGVVFIVRRPPLGQVLESAHDMGREYRIITGLTGTTVPVATPLGYCADPDVTGAPFYAMRYVAGLILRDRDAVERDLPEDRRHTLGLNMADTLARLHALVPDAVGLGELGRTEGYIARQLRRWHRQWQESRTREVPAIEEVHRRLLARIPAQDRAAIVHGDFRIDNLVFSPHAEVRAVLDWELCTLGDPLADLGMLMVYWLQPGESGEHLMGRAPTALRGFPTREEMLARYADLAGVDVSDIDYYRAFGYWKLACIGEGVYKRYRAGVMGQEDVSLEAIERHVLLLADAALEASEHAD
jgi:aminoglycoside phosphotransferase (APT) family kinase protein